MGPSWIIVDQISHFKICIWIIGFKVPLDDMPSISNRYVNKYAQSDNNSDSSKVPKYSYPHSASYSAVSQKRLGAKLQIPKSMSISHMSKLGKLQKKERQTVLMSARKNGSR